MSIDFVKLFNDKNIPVRTTSRGWVNVNCPFCKNPIDTHFNLGISLGSDSISSNCWRCGKHNYLEALSLIFHISPIEVRKITSGYASNTSSVTTKKQASAKSLELPGYEALTKGEMEYLSNRGYNIEELQKKFGIHGGGICGEWSYRIIVPIYYKSKLVSYTGRSILDKKVIKELDIPRYKNLSIENSVVSPKDIFFNLDYSNNEYVILVEGPFDVLKMGDDTICSLGTSVTSAQKLLLSKRYQKIFIAFDNEESAQEKARKLGVELSCLGMEVEVVNICKDFNKNDPGELTPKEVYQIKKELFYDER